VSLIYTISTATTGEPVPLVDLKRFLRVDFAEHDALITSLAKAARADVEMRTHRQLMKAVYNLYLDSFPGEIRIPLSPLISIGTIAYIDADGTSQTDLVEDTDYTVDTDMEPGRVYPVYGGAWPSTRSQRKAVTIPFTCGYSNSATVSTQQAAVPESLAAAIKLKTQLLYDQPEPKLAAMLEERYLALLGPETVPATEAAYSG